MGRIFIDNGNYANIYLINNMIYKEAINNEWEIYCMNREKKIIEFLQKENIPFYPKLIELKEKGYIMEKCDLKLKDFFEELQIQDVYINLFLQLLVGMLNLNLQDILHNDLYSPNIMLKFSDINYKYNITIKNKLFVLYSNHNIFDVSIIPIIIDFGLCTSNKLKGYTFEGVEGDSHNLLQFVESYKYKTFDKLLKKMINLELLFEGKHVTTLENINPYLRDIIALIFSFYRQFKHISFFKKIIKIITKQLNKDIKSSNDLIEIVYEIFLISPKFNFNFTNYQEINIKF